MENYTVIIVALKEILAIYTPLKMALTLVAVMLVYRLPEIINALKNLRAP